MKHYKIILNLALLLAFIGLSIAADAAEQSSRKKGSSPMQISQELYVPTFMTKEINYFASAFDFERDSDCEFHPGFGKLIKAGEDCEARVSVSIPVGSLIKSIKPLWKDGSTTCGIQIQGKHFHNTTNNYGILEDVFTSFFISSNFFQRPHYINIPAKPYNTYHLATGHEVLSGHYYAIHVIFTGDAYDGNNNTCALTGVTVRYDEPQL